MEGRAASAVSASLCFYDTVLSLVLSVRRKLKAGQPPAFTVGPYFISFFHREKKNIAYSGCIRNGEFRD